jgi:hypothetical protein
MPNLTESDLRDPTPPIPGERERTLVAARAHQLGRRRRMMQGVGALAVVAAVSVSVAALTAGGSGSSGTSRVEAASSPETTDAAVTTAAPTTIAVTLPPAPAPDTAPAATQETSAPAVEQPAPTVTQAPAVPSTFTVSGTISNFPAGHEVTVTFSGPGGSFTATADAAGNFSVGGLPAGTYDVIGQHVDPTDSATFAERLGTVTISGDSSVSLSFS